MDNGSQHSKVDSSWHPLSLFHSQASSLAFAITRARIVNIWVFIFILLMDLAFKSDENLNFGWNLHRAEILLEYQIFSMEISIQREFHWKFKVSLKSYAKSIEHCYWSIFPSYFPSLYQRIFVVIDPRPKAIPSTSQIMWRRRFPSA